MLMDNLSYLNQIAPKPKPILKSPSGLFDAKTIKLIILAVGAILIFIVAAVISSSAGQKETTLSATLLLRLNNLHSTVTTYSRDLKSSSLRATTTQLSTMLEATKNNLTAHFKDRNITTTSAPQEVQKSEEEKKAALEQGLQNAKLNGQLDREFARAIALELNRLFTLEHELSNITSNEQLKTLLETSTNNLSPLATKLDEYGM
jgi:hypothetical protein